MKRRVVIPALGPFFYLKGQWKVRLMLIFLFIFLTLLTQVGGIVLRAGLPLMDAVRLSRAFQTLVARQPRSG